MRTRRYRWFCFVLGCMHAGSLVYTFDIAPENKAVVFGKAFLLICSKHGRDTNISWFNPEGQLVAMNDMIAGGYDVMWTARNGESQLCIPSAKMSSGGEYICQADYNSQREQVSSQVIVLETCQLQCIQTSNILIEGDNATILCEVRYAGLWAPALEWQDMRGLNLNATENETDSTTARKRLAVRARRELNRIPFKCIGSFDQPKHNVTPSHAINSPSVQFQACSVSFQIHWPPTENRIRFLPQKERYCEGETVTCMADTNPLATYIRWRGADAEILSNTATIQIGRTCRSSCYCEVGNYVGMVGQQQLRFARRYLGDVVGTKRGRHKIKRRSVTCDNRKQRDKNLELATYLPEVGTSSLYQASAANHGFAPWSFWMLFSIGYWILSASLNTRFPDEDGCTGPLRGSGRQRCKSANGSTPQVTPPSPHRHVSSSTVCGRQEGNQRDLS